jgi:pimeloyl-ACP methyl ester carboxylesterase
MSLAVKPKVVVTIHGIQTHGKWQKQITPYLAKYGLVPYHIDFGWFSVLKFLIPFTRERQVERIRDELRDLVDRSGTRRISMIAHSFGTFLAVEALTRENGNFTYDRLVLTGSIVPRNFDWKGAFDRHWVTAVRNERATRDWVVSLACFASRRLRWITWLKAGDSGRNQFDQELPQLLDDFVVGSHSETHNRLKYEQWARFIAYPVFPEDILEKVQVEMSALQVTAAKLLDEVPENIRINMFAPMSGALRLVPGANINMTYAPELTMKIAMGHGGAGQAFETGNACIVVKRGATWSGNSLPGTELEKLNPTLRWVISIPVKSKLREITVGVINIDGLNNFPPKLVDAIGQSNSDMIVALQFGFIPKFQQCLDAAFRGEFLPQMEG